MEAFWNCTAVRLLDLIEQEIEPALSFDNILNEFTCYDLKARYDEKALGEEEMRHTMKCYGPRGGSRNLEKWWRSMLATMVGRRRKF